jgi:hypothetical protein
VIRPRGNEVEAVVRVLESDEFDSPEAMATALVKVVATELAKRDTLGVAAGFPGEGPVLAVGPFYDQKDVKKYVQSAQECGLETRVRRLGSPLPLDPAAPAKSPCGGCEHDKVFHGSWGCGVYPDKKNRCPCLGY